MKLCTCINSLVISSLLGFFTGCKAQPTFPATLMEMNKPEYLLKDTGFWNKDETQHFLYYASKQLDRELINRIKENQEKNIVHIAAIMNIKQLDTLPKIKVWIFNSDYEKYLKTQVRSNAHSLTEYWSAYYNKQNATGAHEIAHIMSQHYWGFLKAKQYSFLLEEGFTFYADENRFFTFDFYTKARSILDNESYRIAAILKENNNDNYENKATVCGAFVKYLITNYGVEKWAELWKNLDSDKTFTAVFNKSLPELETEFYKHLETQ